jgi:L-methionine (R)-S-oxide reductase
MEDDSKRARYRRIAEQVDGLLAKTADPIARMATIAALLHHKMPGFSWTGFYRLEGGDLVVGPYQGLLACQVLQRHTGVCWAAVDRGGTVVVPDVHLFPGHIACDESSRSEIVVPVRNADGTIVAVLDVDSRKPGNFDESDREGLEPLAARIFGRA